MDLSSNFGCVLTNLLCHLGFLRIFNHPLNKLQLSSFKLFIQNKVRLQAGLEYRTQYMLHVTIPSLQADSLFLSRKCALHSEMLRTKVSLMANPPFGLKSFPPALQMHLQCPSPNKHRSNFFFLLKLKDFFQARKSKRKHRRPGPHDWWLSLYCGGVSL